MKWVLLLPILCILQETRSYPQHYCAECNQHEVIDHTKRDTDPVARLLDSRAWVPRLSLLPALNNAFNNTFFYMSEKLELLEEKCKQITKRLKEIVDEFILSKEKDKKHPATTESTISSASKPEDLNQIVSKPDGSIVNRKPVPVKDDKKKKPAEQGDKEDTPAPIKNENTIAPSSNEKTVSTTPTNQAETTIKENGQTEKPEILHDESEKLQTTPPSQEKLQSEASKNGESETENAQKSDNEEMIKEKDP